MTHWNGKQYYGFVQKSLVQLVHHKQIHAHNRILVRAIAIFDIQFALPDCHQYHQYNYLQLSAHKKWKNNRLSNYDTKKRCTVMHLNNKQLKTNDGICKMHLRHRKNGSEVILVTHKYIFMY